METTALEELPESALEIINDEELNAIEACLISYPQTEYPLKEFFIEKNGNLNAGMYVRETLLPANTFFTTEIHLTRHPFVLSKGHVKVWTRKDGWKEFSAPYTGITEPYTRRLIYTYKEAVWTTFHASEGASVEQIRSEIILPHEIKPDPTLNIQTLVLALK